MSKENATHDNQEREYRQEMLERSQSIFPNDSPISVEPTEEDFLTKLYNDVYGRKPGIFIRDNESHILALKAVRDYGRLNGRTVIT